MIFIDKEDWKSDYFKLYAGASDNSEELKRAENLKLKHFPPALAQYYDSDLDEDELNRIVTGKIHMVKTGKSDNYAPEIVDIDYQKTIKSQLNILMQEQMKKLDQEDPDFLTDEEKEIIDNADFPFIKLMTLVYTKDTKDMTDDEQKEWKDYMNRFITQQIVFGVVNMFFTMKLYRNNIYRTTFQTPYNKTEVWEKYTDNQEGICVTYDFKEISQEMLQRVQSLYPVLYTKKLPGRNDLDFKVYNIFCASMLEVADNIGEYEKQWTYLFCHKYTNTEYMMLDSLLEPVYEKAMGNNKIQEILTNNYLEFEDNNLTYNHEQIIKDISETLESEEFIKQIKDHMDKVYNITPDRFDMEFMKPEAIYLGLNFPEDKIDEYKKTAQKNNIRIFKIKENENGLFKALI